MLERDEVRPDCRLDRSRDSLQDHGSAAPGEPQGGDRRLRPVGRLEDEVERVVQRFEVGVQVVGLPRAQAAREREPRRSAADQREAVRRGQPEHRDREQAQGARADDRDPEVRAQLRLEQPAGDASGGLEKRGGLEVRCRRETVDESGRNAQILGERAGVREAGLGVFGRAQVGPAFPAPIANAARAKSFGNHAIADGDPPHTGADRGHGAGPFVSGHDRVPHVGRRPRSAEDLEVGAADPGGRDADEDLVGSRLGDRQPGEPRDTWTFDHDGAHLVHCPAA